MIRARVKELNFSAKLAGIAGQCSVFHFNGGANGTPTAKWSRGAGGPRRCSQCSSKREAIAEATSSSLEIVLDATILSWNIGGMSGFLHSAGCTAGHSHQGISAPSTASSGSQGPQSWTTVSGLYQRVCFWPVNTDTSIFA